MIYLDYHATTPIFPEAWESMRPFQTEHFGNPASAHQAGRRARRALEDAREKTASLLGAFADEVIFTSGATEANNLALFGLMGDAPAAILASPMEHPCVIEPLKQLASRGFEIDWLPVSSQGLIEVGEVKNRLRPDTRLLSIMLVNHEIGSIQPISEIASLLHEQATLFHCDAAQAVGKLPLHFHQLGVDALSVSAHKFHGPKGIGLLLLKRCTVLQPQLFGGHQQKGRRPGTESVALAVGLTTALEICTRLMTERLVKVTAIRDRFLQRIQEKVKAMTVNSPIEKNSPYVLNLSFLGCRAEMLLLKLDLMGVACSTGSACSSGSLLASPVLRAMAASEAVLGSAMRFSFDPEIDESEIDSAAEKVIQAVGRVAGGD